MSETERYETGYRDGYRMSINELQSLRAQAKELRAALDKAVEIIKQWHNMGGAQDVWQIYYYSAPEMQPIREALAL